MIIESYKPIGQTTVEHVNEFKNKNNIKKICFAGRLDPLAHGKLYILTDEDVHKKDLYCGKDKIYETWIVKNFVTDSYDIMGVPKKSNKKEEVIPNKFKQKYPPYSSVIVPKYHKSFWQVTKLNLKMEDIDIPTKEIEIKNFEYVEKKIICAKELMDIIENRINRVNESQQFRQKEIIKAWSELLKNHDGDITLEKIRVACSSGTYIRNIANMLNSCCFDIHRTSYVN